MTRSLTFVSLKTPVPVMPLNFPVPPSDVTLPSDPVGGARR